MAAPTDVSTPPILLFKAIDIAHDIRQEAIRSLADLM